MQGEHGQPRRPEEGRSRSDGTAEATEDRDKARRPEVPPAGTESDRWANEGGMNDPGEVCPAERPDPSARPGRKGERRLG
jgi:hypothetical protein